MRTMKMKLKVGDPAPDFKLKDEQGNIRSLDEFKGNRLIIYFYPKDDTPGCRKEACSFRDAYQKITSAGIQVLGISYDLPESHRKFKEKYDLPFTLLSDETRDTARAYGAYGGLFRKLGPRRYAFLVNEQRKIIKIFTRVRVEEHASDVLKVFQSKEQTSQ